MAEQPDITLHCDLKLPLDLVNEINAEAVRRRLSIPDMLALMLMDAWSERLSELQPFDLAPDFGAPLPMDSLTTPPVATPAP